MFRINWYYLKSSLENITAKTGRQKIFFILFSVLSLSFISAKAAKASFTEKTEGVKRVEKPAPKMLQEMDVKLFENFGKFESNPEIYSPNNGLKKTSGPDNELIVSGSHIVAINEEFAALLGRFESTIVAIAAHSIGDRLSLGEFVTGNQTRQGTSNNSEAERALTKAKTKYTKFQQLMRSGQYARAKQEWISAKNILLANYPTDRTPATAEVRAIWLDRGTIVKAQGERDLVKLFDRLAAAGINTVFFETLNASYPIYPSKIAPEQNPLTKGWDPLKAAVKLAKARDMELHAWVWTFAAANKRHNEILNKPTDYLGPVLARHPDWAMSDRQGNIFNPKTNKAFYDPANPEVRKYLLSLIEEIASNYEVDGIQLDYIRYPFQSPHADLVFGYSKSARSQFEAKYGIDPIEIGAREPQWYKWNQFRIQQVDRFVEDTSRLLKSRYPNLILSAAVFPSAEGHRSYQIQQNWEKWARKGWVDSLAPMTYANTASELDRKSKPLFNKFIKLGALILPGIRLSNVPDPVVIDQMQLLRHLPTGGYALFAAEYFNANLGNMLGQIQGQVKRSQSILPYREPFKASVVRYDGLQKEWIYLVSKGQISLDRATMQEWASKSQDLETALKDLADRPSNRTFLTARSALRSYQRQFPTWLKQYQQDNTYLVQAWSNRLKSIEDLLSYGDRTVLRSNGSRVVRR
ncbi:MAG: family 10 glycosylhydrolase [Prochloraceae cyanobacterium]|nr:family 10 glycosylhydrolase [Prochloraceae cyanobacterium]